MVTKGGVQKEDVMYYVHCMIKEFYKITAFSDYIAIEIYCLKAIIGHGFQIEFGMTTLFLAIPTL